MKRLWIFLLIVCLATACTSALAEQPATQEGAAASMPAAKLLYQGHASIRITTPEGKTIYIDPYAGKGYDVPADLILVTHKHSDHYKLKLIKNKNEGCQTITNSEALVDGVYQTFDLGYVRVEAVQAGNNPNHDIKVCVGYILTLSDGITLYISGDTSRTDQMATLAERKLDYAFFCCDGKYNMDAAEAAACADLVGARYSIPYHTQVGKLFNAKIAEKFTAQNRMIIEPAEEIELH